MSKKNDPQPWKLIRAEEGPDLRLFRVKYKWMVNPRNGRELKRLVLETPDWVNIIALTPEEKFVLVRQYRFGSDRVTLEIPGGVVDPGESHKEAAVRELQEETGYTAGEWEYLGSVEPNPAFLTNRCHHWLALNARLTHTPAPDEGEDLAVITLTAEEVRAAVHTGEIGHVLVLSALSRVMNLWNTLL
ncbi:MAG: NUDIX hydrolase [Calditrichaeota bacterium]|nr:MAG: NUDIX hydrolase [Calditrichota bacterium]